VHEVSGGRPKCLIEIGGASLLRRLLDGLAACGVADAVVVTGYGADAVRAAVASPPAGMRVRTLYNTRFQEGAILSLATARALLDGPVLVMDADVLCPTVMIRRLVESPHPSAFLLDASSENTGEEQMLLVRDGRVQNIGAAARPATSPWASRSIPELTPRPPGCPRSPRRADRPATPVSSTESVELLARRSRPERVDGMWTEIDFPEDVARRARGAAASRDGERGRAGRRRPRHPEDLPGVAGVPPSRTILVPAVRHRAWHVPGTVEVRARPRIRVTIGREAIRGRAPRRRRGPVDQTRARGLERHAVR
jgi:choline kinase